MIAVWSSSEEDSEGTSGPPWRDGLNRSLSVMRWEAGAAVHQAGSPPSFYLSTADTLGPLYLRMSQGK